MKPLLRPDSVFAQLPDGDIINAQKFMDDEDFGDTCGLNEKQFKRLEALGFIEEDKTNKGLWWATPRLEELSNDLIEAATGTRPQPIR